MVEGGFLATRLKMENNIANSLSRQKARLISHTRLGIESLYQVKSEPEHLYYYATYTLVTPYFVFMFLESSSLTIVFE
jgi:hypothetical protein